MNNRVTRNYGIVVIALVLVLVMFVAGALQPSQDGERAVYLPAARVENVSQDEWLARHWQWTLSLPASSNPGLDVSGRSCASGHSGPVFFIPRNFAPCIVPAGKSIVIPFAGTECSTSESAPYTGTTEDELRDCAEHETERYTNIRVTIDGDEVPNIESYRVSSPLFAVSLPEGNVLGAPAGLTWVVADGYQVVLKPLAPGEHEIIVHLELADGTVLPDKLLHLTVVEPTWERPAASPSPLVPLATPVNATPNATPE